MTLQIEGQTNIFDFLDAPAAPVKVFAVGATVKVKYYDDELAYVRECLPQLMEEGEIIEACGTYYKVAIAGEVISVDGEKLNLC